jgi:hypothetical protein
MSTARSLVAHKPSLSVLPRDPDVGPVGMASAGDYARNAGAAVDSLTGGRISMTMLVGVIVALAGFYVWTHGVQGGG